MYTSNQLRSKAMIAMIAISGVASIYYHYYYYSLSRLTMGVTDFCHYCFGGYFFHVRAICTGDQSSTLFSVNCRAIPLTRHFVKLCYDGRI